MQFSTICAVAATFAASAHAKIDTLAFPATIKPGDTFDVTGEQLISQPRHHTGVFGITSGSTSYPGSIGSTIFRSFDLTQLPGTFNITLSSFSVPDAVSSGPATIQAVFLSFYGVFNTPDLETWQWNVTIGDATSEDRVSARATGPGCSLE